MATLQISCHTVSCKPNYIATLLQRRIYVVRQQRIHNLNPTLPNVVCRLGCYLYVSADTNEPSAKCVLATIQSRTTDESLLKY